MAGQEHLRSIELEISTKCTIKCPGCPRNYQLERKWNTGFMDIDVLKNLVNGTNYNQYIFCGAYGDAIYHPKIVEILEFMISTGKRFMIETNGSYIKSDTWNAIANLDWNRKNNTFTFSIDGLEDTNHIYRKNSNWDSIITGITALDNADKKPYLIWKYLVFPYNEHQVEEARVLSKQLGFGSFEAVKSLRKYNDEWFEGPEERAQIDWKN